MTDKEKRKIEFLNNLRYLEECGAILDKEYTMNDSIEEIEAQYIKQRNIMEDDESLFNLIYILFLFMLY